MTLWTQCLPIAGQMDLIDYYDADLIIKGRISQKSTEFRRCCLLWVHEKMVILAFTNAVKLIWIQELCVTSNETWFVLFRDF